MGDPAREVECSGGGLQVERIVGKGGDVKVITHVIQCHQYHGYASQNIDGLYSLLRGLIESLHNWLHCVRAYKVKYSYELDPRAPCLKSDCKYLLQWK